MIHLFFVQIFTILLFSSCTHSEEKQSSFSHERNASFMIERSEKFCSSDEECVVIQADCCGCQAGGANTAVARKYFKQAVQRKNKLCASTMCMMVLSDHDSCVYHHAQCVSGVCKLPSER